VRVWARLGTIFPVALGVWPVGGGRGAVVAAATHVFRGKTAIGGLAVGPRQSFVVQPVRGVG